MQIGIRWPAREAAPASVPKPLADIAATRNEGAFTLTWLEGRPVLEHSGGQRWTVAHPGRHAIEITPQESGAGGGTGALEKEGSEDELFPHMWA